MTEPANYAPLNSAWLTQNINTNATAGVQLSEARAALATNEAAKAVLANFNDVPDGVDPTIDTEQLAKLLIEASLTQPIHINTPGGLVAVLDGSVIPDIEPNEDTVQQEEARSVVLPIQSDETPDSAPSDEPAAKGALATIKDVSKAFRKDTPEEIRQKATDCTLTIQEAKMWATTTTREGRELLGISGRMDEADRAILVKQHLSRKAEPKAGAPAGADAADTPKKGFFSKAVDTVTWPFRKAWEGIKKGVNWVTGKKEMGAPERAEITSTAAEPIVEEADTEPGPKPAEPPTITETNLEAPPVVQPKKEHVITGGDSLWNIARQNLIDNGVTSPTNPLISKRARQILDANPGIDPNSLKPGTKISFPDYDQSVLDKSPGLVTEPEAPPTSKLPAPPPAEPEPAADSKTGVEDLARQAFAASVSGDLEAAEALYRQALEQSPDNGKLHFEFSGVLLEQGKLKESFNMLETAQSKGYRDDVVLCVAYDNIGKAYSKLVFDSIKSEKSTRGATKSADYSEAIRCFEKAHTFNPDDVAVLYHHAVLLFNAGQRDGSIPLFKEAADGGYDIPGDIKELIK